MNNYLHGYGDNFVFQIQDRVTDMNLPDMVNETALDDHFNEMNRTDKADDKRYRIAKYI